MSDFQWTEQRTEALITMVKAGRSYTEISAVLGCGSRNAISGKVMRLRDRGMIDGPRSFVSGSGNESVRRCAPGLAHVPLIKDRLKEGRNDRQIADEIGLKPEDVRYVRRIKNLKGTKWGGSPPWAAELAKLVQSGKTDREIGKELGISIWEARYERRRQGLKPLEGSTCRRAQVTTLVKGDPFAKVAAVFAEGFMGQRSRVGLVDLPATGACRFPIDQPGGEVRYCGDAAEDGNSYCSHHASRCYTPVPVKASIVKPGRR